MLRPRRYGGTSGRARGDTQRERQRCLQRLRNSFGGVCLRARNNPSVPSKKPGYRPVCATECSRGCIAAAPTSHTSFVVSFPSPPSFSLSLSPLLLLLLLLLPLRLLLLVLLVVLVGRVTAHTVCVPFPLVYSTAPGLCTRVVCASTCVHTRRCTPREQRRVLRPELSRSHGSSSGSGGDIPTYLPISLAARACVSQATLRILLLSLLPRVVVLRRSSSFTSFDTVNRTLTRRPREPRLARSLARSLASVSNGLCILIGRAGNPASQPFIGRGQSTEERI